MAERNRFHVGGVSVCGRILLALAMAANWHAISDDRVVGAQQVELLEDIAARNEVNYRKLQTWSAKYGFVEKAPMNIQVDPRPHASKVSPSDAVSAQPPRVEKALLYSEGMIEFAVDVASDKLWSDYNEDGNKSKFVSIETNKPLNALARKPFRQKEILTADRVTKLSENMEFGPLPEFPDDPHAIDRSTGKLAVRDVIHPYDLSGDWYRKLDPRRFFAVSSRPIWEDLRSYSGALKGEFGQDQQSKVSQVLNIESTGDPGSRKIKLTMKFFSGTPDDEKGLLTLNVQFSEADGYLPVEQTMTSRLGHLHERRTWAYRKENGIAIPQEFHFIMHDPDNGSLIIDRHLTYAGGEVNGSLPDDVFEPSHLGLASGDRLLDKVQNKLYVSDGAGGFSSPQQFDEVRSGAQDLRSNSYHWLIAINIAAVVCIVVIVVIYRRGRIAGS